jgi:hypothetical protein
MNISFRGGAKMFAKKVLRKIFLYKRYNKGKGIPVTGRGGP